ncbi:MAG: single-stranded DNA-binding protein [Actinomycetota bacterium]|nr:single-stranded DNA-binding protein [Actinomycetota bacterium]
MAASNINRVVLTGNLTADPDLRETSGGLQVCKLRVACNTRRKQGDTWVDKPNYFDVTVFGTQGVNAHKYLSKGRPVAIDGRLEWREWQDKESGKNRQSIDIIADSVQFLGSRDDNGGGSGGSGQSFQGGSDIPVDTSDFASPAPAPVGGGSSTGDDDIPF